jgi:tetrapyrrole methylase family protein/MazG family protein
MAGITLLGLGPGDPRLLTRQAWQVLAEADEIYLRTRQHITVEGLPSGLRIHSFDHLYREHRSFEDVYDRIVEEVLTLGQRPQGVIYALPGHPFVAEATGPEIARRAEEAEIPVSLVEGLSFLDPVFSSLGVDPLPHTAIVDALTLVEGHHPPFPPDAPALIAQIYDRQIAAQAKINLMAVYPDEHPVKLVHAAGSDDAVVEDVPLYGIDRSEKIGLVTALYVPPLGPATSLESFQEIIAHLRAPEGCPWDREQDHQSLRPNLLEEVYEVVEAIDADDPEAMAEEFGDLLLQIVLHAQIASEYGEFTMADVIRGIHTKIVRRHPHVFGDEILDEAGDVIRNWERLKAVERDQNGEPEKGLLDGVANALPALTQAQTYQKRVKRVGFDWPDMEGVVDKIREEIEELRAAPDAQSRADELGDLLFSVVNLARWLDIDAESALRETNARFRRRFASIEQAARDAGLSLDEMDLDELDSLWEAAKEQ